MDKLVFVKDLSSGLTKTTSKVYPIITDQDGEKWYIFNQDINAIQLQASYLFTFIINDKGYKDIQKITPLTNLFQAKALKEVSNKNDIIRNLTVCLSYSKDLVIGGKIELVDLFLKAYEMYDWLNENADKLMPQSDNPFENDKLKEVKNENIDKIPPAEATA
jgi:hypothetical protein